MKTTSKLFILYALLSGIFFAEVSQAQDGRSEIREKHHDCINPKKIKLTAVPEDDVVYYDNEDKYTFWYVLTPENNVQLSFDISALDEDDEYQEMLYKYNGTTFCNDLVAGELKTLPLMMEDATFEKGETYYLGVLQLTGKGCGHRLNINVAGQERTYYALNSSCNFNIDSLLHQEEKIVISSEVQKDIEEKKINTDSTLAKQKKEAKRSWEGKVLNRHTGDPVDAELIVKRGNKKQFSSSAAEGFLFTLNEDELDITVEAYGYQPLDTTVRYPGKDDSLILAVRPVGKGDKFIMKNIYFHPNTYAIKQTSYPELLQLYRFMEENKDIVIEIQGHTNSNRRIRKNKRYSHLGEAWNFSGSAKKLSQERAETLKKILVKKGVPEKRIETTGYGGDRMIVEDPQTMQEALKNIRVEVHVVEGP